MFPFLSALLACSLQAPQASAATPQQPASSVRLDVIELKSGDELVGRITAELDAYVQIEIAQGATIGVSRAQVAAVRRAAREAPSRAAVVRPDDAYYVLHDADGKSVGWLHTAVTTEQDGAFSVHEEYEFINGARRYQITNQCTADSAGNGRRCYFRERVSSPRLLRQLPVQDQLSSADRVEDERIVEAVAGSEVLTVTRLDGSGRRERQLPWPKGSTFPLLARTLAREAGVELGPSPMFDPRHEELVRRRVDGTGARHVLVDGKRQRVGEVEVTAADGERLGQREWIDAERRVVRRELAGPALVAVPSSAASARVAVGVTTIDSAVVAEADGRFGIWVPNPTWRAVEPLPAGHLALTCAVHEAEVRLSLLDHLGPDTLLDAAADAVANWLGLLYPQLKLDGRRRVQVRGRTAMRMQAVDPRARERATVDVVPFGAQFLVLTCRAPSASWDELSPDFALVRRTLELDGAALNPERTGPLRAGRGGRMRPPVGPMPAPVPAPRVARADAVRVQK
jgi:hypothetical protein